MAAITEKKPSPPYVSYSSFKSFIKGLGESTVPDRVDKTAMRNYSGSVIYALLPALQWMTLIDGDGYPSDLLRQLAGASDEEFGPLLKPLVEQRYSFLVNGNFNLASASSGQVEEAFKAQDIQGSTVTKCIAFFLAIAKESGITVSPHVKPPTIKRNKTQKPKKNGNDNGDGQKDGGEPVKPRHEGHHPGMEKITVPLPGMEDGIIYFPKVMTPEEQALAVKMADFILKNYYKVSNQ